MDFINEAMDFINEAMDFINEAMDFINEAMDFISVHINTKNMVHNGGGPNPVIFTAMERTTKTKSRLPTVLGKWLTVP